MFQVRIHGRGGQGVVTAAEMLSLAAFDEGRFAQAFPSFGSERTGAPVVSFARIDDREIRLREPVMQPDALIIQDPTLLHQVDGDVLDVERDHSAPRGMPFKNDQFASVRGSRVTSSTRSFALAFWADCTA